MVRILPLETKSNIAMTLKIPNQCLLSHTDSPQPRSQKSDFEILDQGIIETFSFSMYHQKITQPVNKIGESLITRGNLMNR